MSEQQQQTPLYTAEPETPEQAEERQWLKQIFSDIESRQLEFLDEAGKSIIERVSTLLALLLAISAFGGNFPPSYLKSNMLDKSLIIAILGCYILAMGMWAIYPRSYSLYRYNMTRVRKELDRIIAH